MLSPSRKCVLLLLIKLFLLSLLLSQAEAEMQKELDRTEKELQACLDRESNIKKQMLEWRGTGFLLTVAAVVTVGCDCQAHWMPWRPVWRT